MSVVQFVPQRTVSHSEDSGQNSSSSWIGAVQLVLDGSPFHMDSPVVVRELGPITRSGPSLAEVDGFSPVKALS